MASVNTNYGALIALQNLNSTQRDLATTQNRISTGLEVAGAADNGAIYSIAQEQRGRLGSIGAVRDGVDRAISTVDTALAAGQSVSDVLIQLRELAVSAQSGALSAAQVATLQADFSALRTQIDSILGAAQFNGTNLVANNNDLTVLATDEGGAAPAPPTITVTGTDLRIATAGSPLATLAALDISTAAPAAVDAIDTATTTFNSALATLGGQRRALDTQNTFLTALSDNVERGIGNLVDADLARESARLQSLQVRQQLGSQALSIANSSTQVVLSFFRN